MTNKEFSQNQSLEKKAVKVVSKYTMQKQSVAEYVADYEDEHPSLYVGTYAKYNEGSIFGEWIDLTKCGSYDEFMEVCHKLHADEEDPELMFQDYENFPHPWYSESGIDEEVFDKIIKFSELDEDEQEAYREFVDSFSEDDFDSFKERYQGKWDSEKDFAEHIVDECYNLDDMMGSLSSYFDYEAYARDLFIEDYYFSNGFVFRR